MTIITESLISECQSQRAVCLNETLNIAIEKTRETAGKLDIDFKITSKDVQKILKHNIIIEICELKKQLFFNSTFYINIKEYDDSIIKVFNEILIKMELNKGEKSSNFLKNFKSYLKRNGFTYIINVYLKQASNKLALFR